MGVWRDEVPRTVDTLSDRRGFETTNPPIHTSYDVQGAAHDTEIHSGRTNQEAFSIAFRDSPNRPPRRCPVLHRPKVC